MLPQLIFIALTFIGLLLHAYQHGKPKIGVGNFWHSFWATAATISLLYWGGFFDVFVK